MKRWLWYLGVVAAVAALSAKPSAGKDIGKLQPVQAVCVSCSEGMVLVQTDTGDWGEGETLPGAVERMKETAAGEVFLETADYLLLSPDCADLLPAMMEYLRPSCSVCLMEGDPDMEKVGSFMQIHAPQVTLMRYRAGDRKLQTLVTQDGRMCLVS